jgi:hypothetical protein
MAIRILLVIESELLLDTDLIKIIINNYIFYLYNI